jgi:hypothetical protein
MERRIPSFTDLHRRAGLGEVLMVDELAAKARERLAEKIRPSQALSLPRRHRRAARRGAGVFRSSLKRQLLSPLRMRGLLIYLPQFVRLFGRLMENRLVPLLASSHGPGVAGSAHTASDRTRLHSGLSARLTGCWSAISPSNSLSGYAHPANMSAGSRGAASSV